MDMTLNTVQEAVQAAAQTTAQAAAQTTAQAAARMTAQTARMAVQSSPRDAGRADMRMAAQAGARDAGRADMRMAAQAGARNAGRAGACNGSPTGARGIACNAARKMTAALAAAALAAGCGLGMAAPAWAEDATLTIEQHANGEAGYRAYQVFKADVYADGDDAVATHIEWSSDAMRSVVTAFLNQTDARTGARVYDYAGGDNPQQAAEYIGAMIRDGAVDVDAETEPPTPAAASFAMELAKALANSSIEPRAASAGEAFTGPEGYWLFVSDGASIGTDEAGTAPMWLPLGGVAGPVQAKESAPTVMKQVREDSSGQWGPAADASTGEDLDYRITATLPANLGAMSKYRLKLADTFPSGMTLAGGNLDSVRVTADGVDVSSQAHVDWNAGVLTVDIADVKSLAGVTVNRDSSIVAEYRAHLDATRVIGAEGNRNGVVMTYTADPVTLGEGSATPAATQTYSYGLDLVKHDKATGAVLAGARYTLQVEDTQGEGGGAASGGFSDSNKGKYVQADGGLGDAAHEFETGADGSFQVMGLDAGTYRLCEVAAPAGFEKQDADITLVLAAAIDGWELSSLAATATGGEQTHTADTDILTHVESVNSTAGVAKLQTSDDKMVVMPLTGLAGVAVFYLAGAALVLLSGAGLVVTRLRGRSGAGKR